MELSYIVNTEKKPGYVRNCYGMTNLMPTGNFESANEWSALYGSVTASNNKLVTTFDGTNKAFSVYSNTSITMASLYGKKVAVRVKMKAAGDADPTKFVIKLRGVTSGTSAYEYVETLSKNETHTLTAIADLSSVYGSGNLRIYLEIHYRTSADISECSMECSELMIINLTDAFGAGNEPDADCLNHIIDHFLPSPWFAGSVMFDFSTNRKQADDMIDELKNVQNKLDKVNEDISSGIVTVQNKLDAISSAVPNKYELVNIPNKLILACFKRILLSYNYTKYEVSFDAGETWQDCSGVDTQNAEPIALIFRSGKAVIFGLDAYYYSDDAITYTKVSYSSAGIQAAPYYTGVSLMPPNQIDTAIFGEYTNHTSYEAGEHCYLWKTTDAGHTWTKVFDITTDIRHIHTVTYLRNKTYGGVLATSGDKDNQVQWWHSPDFGTTWNNIVDGSSNDVTNPQDYRSLGQVFDEDGNVYWSVDNDYNDITSVYKAHITTPLNKTKVLDVCGIGYGLKRAGNIMIMNSVPSISGLQPVTASFVYCSLDGGEHWDIVLIDKGLSDNNRLSRVIGPDAFGRFYLPHSAMEAGGYSQGTYRIEIKDKRWVHD